MVTIRLFIEDYKRASLAGALPEPGVLLRQLDELCEEAHPGECDKHITDYQRARLAGMFVDLGLQVAQLEQAFEAENKARNERSRCLGCDDEDDEPVCDECGMHDCDGECVDYAEDEACEDEF